MPGGTSKTQYFGTKKQQMLIICQIDWREVGVAFEMQCFRNCTLSSYLIITVNRGKSGRYPQNAVYYGLVSLSLGANLSIAGVKKAKRRRNSGDVKTVWADPESGVSCLSWLHPLPSFVRPQIAPRVTSSVDEFQILAVCYRILACLERRDAVQ